MTTTVEFATGEGLVKYEITDGDLSGVKPEHLVQVRSALSLDLEPLAADEPAEQPAELPGSPAAEPAADAPPTPSRGRGRSKE